MIKRSLFLHLLWQEAVLSVSYSIVFSTMLADRHAPLHLATIQYTRIKLTTESIALQLVNRNKSRIYKLYKTNTRCTLMSNQLEEQRFLKITTSKQRT